MCNRVKVPTKERAEETFKAKVQLPELYKPYYHVNAWDKALLPTIHSEDRGIIMLDPWATDKGFDIYNARNDKVFENMHKKNIFERRVLVLVDGFFEYRAVGKKKYPYFIRLNHGKPFALGGFLNNFNWISIVTTEANETMKMIHNQAERMPLILTPETQYRWLEPDLIEGEIKDLMIPCPDEMLQYHTVGKIPQGLEKSNVEETIQEVVYPELNQLF